MAERVVVVGESEPSSELENNEPSAVYRYYDYVATAEGNAATVLMALSELLDHLPAKIHLPIDMLFDVEAYEQSYQADPRATCEALSLMPLRYISPRLEQSDCPVDELRAWYDDVVKKIIYQTKKRTTAAALAIVMTIPRQ